MLNVGARVLTHVNVVILVVRSPLPLLGNKWPEFSKIVASDLEIFLTILMSNWIYVAFMYVFVAFRYLDEVSTGYHSKKN
jgi:hypothetical protein